MERYSRKRCLPFCLDGPPVGLKQLCQLIYLASPPSSTNGCHAQHAPNLQKSGWFGWESFSGGSKQTLNVGYLHVLYTCYVYIYIIYIYIHINIHTWHTPKTYASDMLTDCVSCISMCTCTHIYIYIHWCFKYFIYCTYCIYYIPCIYIYILYCIYTVYRLYNRLYIDCIFTVYMIYCVYTLHTVYSVHCLCTYMYIYVYIRTCMYSCIIYIYS